MSFNLNRATSDKAETCFRCSSLGLPAEGIAIGESFVAIESDGKKECACMDCFSRLFEEIEEMEGEEWKQ